MQLDGRELLTPMDLTFAARAWTGIVGPNGGGKSTLMKAIAGLVNHVGDITLHWPQAYPGRIGYMPQRVELDTSLPVTVQDYLRMHCKRRPVWLKPEQDERLAELIETLEVQPFIQQRIGSLSMGQHQRLMLCATLSNDPQLLMLDEPLAGVDEAGREILLRVLQAYHRDGGSILMVEHNWDVIRDHCTQVVWIDQGLVSVGTPEKILQLLGDRVSPFELQLANPEAAAAENQQDDD
ncbi:MAG: ATP-binding cassette domain-containing protein [Pseudomonadota bacterium]